MNYPALGTNKAAVRRKTRIHLERLQAMCESHLKMIA